MRNRKKVVARWIIEAEVRYKERDVHRQVVLS